MEMAPASGVRPTEIDPTIAFSLMPQMSTRLAELLTRYSLPRSSSRTMSEGVPPRPMIEPKVAADGCWARAALGPAIHKITNEKMTLRESRFTNLCSWRTRQIYLTSKKRTEGKSLKGDTRAAKACYN